MIGGAAMAVAATDSSGMAEAGRSPVLDRRDEQDVPEAHRGRTTEHVPPSCQPCGTRLGLDANGRPW